MQLLSMIPAERGTYEVDGATATLVVAWAHIGREGPIVDTIVGVTIDDLPIMDDVALMGIVNRASAGVRYTSNVPAGTNVKR